MPINYPKPRPRRWPLFFVLVIFNGKFSVNANIISVAGDTGPPRSLPLHHRQASS